MSIVRNALNMFLPPRIEPSKAAAPASEIDRKEVPPNREVLLSWEAPTRSFRPRSPEFYKKVVTLLMAGGVVLILAGQFTLLILLVSLAVLFYVLSSVPPERAHHELDNYGVNCFEKQYYWKEFKYFFFTREGNYDILNLDTVEPYPGRLVLLLEGVSVDKVQEIVGSKIPFQKEPPKTMFDTALHQISSKLSLE